MANISILNANVTLEELNHEEMVRRIPLLVFLSILLSIGLPGNICVLVIFLKHYKEDAYRVYRIFIVALAVLDTLTCSVCIPFEILDSVFIYTFYDETSCNLLRTLELVIIIATVWVTFGLTLFRYQKVCRYKKPQMTEKIAKIFCIVSMLFCVVMSAPMMKYTGITHVELRHNITGYDCYMSEDFTSSNLDFFKVIGFALFAFYILGMTGIVLMYVLIGKTLYKRASLNKRIREYTSRIDQDLTDQSIDDNGDQLENAENSIELSGTPIFRQQMSKVLNKSRDEIEFDKTRKRLTGISFAVSSLFIGSYLPILILCLIALAKYETYDSSPDEAYAFAVAPAFILRLIFVRNIGNPIIYILFDKKYRDLVKECFSKRI